MILKQELRPKANENRYCCNCSKTTFQRVNHNVIDIYLCSQSTHHLSVYCIFDTKSVISVQSAHHRKYDRKRCTSFGFDSRCGLGSFRFESLRFDMDLCDLGLAIGLVKTVE